MGSYICISAGGDSLLCYGDFFSRGESGGTTVTFKGRDGPLKWWGDKGNLIGLLNLTFLGRGEVTRFFEGGLE